MNPLDDFAHRLTAERKRIGLTQAQFADACGVKAASQFLYEKGERTPNAEYLLRAKSIGTSIGYLFDERSNPSSAASLSPEELGQLYKQTDDICRDEFGRLLDLEYRVSQFITLIQKDSHSFTKVANS